MCRDLYSSRDARKLSVLRERLRHEFVQVLPLLPEAEEQLDQILGDDVPLGVLTDVISYMLDIDPHRKEALLAECDVTHRAELLLRHLSAATAQRQIHARRAACFPPLFSVN
jgi:Lon protease-like protein